MSNSVAAKGGWLKKLAIAGACLVVLLVIGFFYVTSASFLKSFILPRASQTMGATITVEDATISPFSEVTLRGLKVQTTGSEPLLQAQEVHAHYKLMDIIGGHINVSEAIITGPTVVLVQNADGTSNLDPILKATAGDPNKPRKSGSGDKPTLLDVKNVELKNATVRVLRTNKDGSRETVELKNVNLTADQLKNGANTKLALATDITVERAGKTNDFMQAKFTVNVDVALDEKLAPKSAKAEKTSFSISEGRGAMKDLAGLAAEVQIDWTPTEVKALGVKFTQSGKNLGEIRASGPFDPAKLEGKLKLEVAGIDRQVLSLAGGALGMDFGSTVLNTSNNVELSRGGQNVTINGQLTANRFSVSQKGQTTPAMDVQVNYALNVDQTAKTALVQSFTVNGTQNQKQLLRGALAKPMKLDWGKAGEAVDESSFDLAVSDLNLAEWRAFTGESIQTGIANVKLGVVSQKAGRKLLLNTTASVENLSAQSGSNRLDQASVLAELRAQVDEFSQVLLQQASVKLTQQRDAVATATISGTYDTKTQAADLQANLDGVLAKLVALAKVPDMAISSGNVKFAGKVSQKALAAGQPTNAVPDRAVTGQLRLENFTGQMASNRLNQVDAIVDCDVSVKSQVAEIRKLAGSLRQAGQDAGRFEVTGTYQLANETGQFTVTLADLNQLAVGPFMAGALGDKTLKTISINSKTTATYDAKGQSSLNAELQVSKLVVHDPKGALPNTPLEVKLAANGTYGKNVLDLKNVLLSLTPTARATNQVSLQGQLDMSKTNALKGNLAVTADSLDLTPYYDLFDHPAATNGKPAQATAPAPAGSGNAEPAAMQLPVQSLVASVKVGRCYLREVAITNLATTLTITNNQILLNPMQFVLNGAPVNAKADINVGVVGYLYDISFSGNRIPLEPLANSFIPDKRGMYQGDILANVQIKGAGVTGLNMKKNLAGQASFSFTNANIHIVGPRAKSILSPIAFVLNLPEVLESPLNWINVQADIGQGQVKLKDVAVLSQAFRMDAPGTIVFADILTNSTLNLPVDFSLRRSIAEKSNLLAANTPTNAAYAKLPTFAKVTGTVGQPKTETDKLVISGLLLRSAVSMPIAAGTKAGNIVQGVGNLLTGNKATNAAPATNVTDKPKINALDLLRNALEKDKDKPK